MQKKIYSIFLFLSCWLTGIVAHAQSPANAGNEKVEMADLLRANGKIYVVVACLVIILLGLFVYVVRLDRKIGRLEKEIK